jgi:hypothetical protein
MINALMVAIFDCRLLTFQHLKEEFVMIHEHTGNLVSGVVSLRNVQDFRQPFFA